MDILVAGGGLCGALMALALSQRRLGVTLLTGSAHPRPIPAATGYSYGGIPWWMGVGDGGRMLSGQGLTCWRQLQERHGDLGLRPAKLLLHWSAADDNAAVEAAVAALAASLPEGARPERRGRSTFCGGDLQALGLTCAGAVELPYGRIDGRRYRPAMDRLLQSQGVKRSPGAVDQLLVRHGRCMGVRLTNGDVLESDGVVLATGAAMASLLPLPEAGRWLPYGWASVLPLQQQPWPEVILLPLLGRREPMERQGWTGLVVDPGLAPWGGGVVFGQATSLQHWSGLPGATPSVLTGPWQPSVAEAQLRRALADLAPGLAVAARRQRSAVRHCPVSYSPDGRPWVGGCPGIANLWLFGGFRGGFALAPLLAPLLAEAVAHHSTLAEELGVDPARLLAQQDCPPPQEEGRGDSAS
ncbi:NAD(P)/FAD-dependent oxidoreductase [Candidatus Synechococcus spongiarum]|uniref:NAD(P)/FAD-dependent oxidoreductase n=1 Tax=Candidatus Synechococcus spongiarum TaxID=431041 RepID=UPI00046F9F18|nr:FAD-binding oxidoreductase [Candidatus Synechococcus spongiarum]